MHELETIDPTALAQVTGGAFPIKPIIRGAEAVYNGAKAAGSAAWSGIKTGSQYAYKGITELGAVKAGYDALKEGYGTVKGWFGGGGDQKQPSAPIEE